MTGVQSENGRYWLFNKVSALWYWKVTAIKNIKNKPDYEIHILDSIEKEGFFFSLLCITFLNKNWAEAYSELPPEVTGSFAIDFEETSIYVEAELPLEQK